MRRVKRVAATCLLLLGTHALGACANNQVTLFRALFDTDTVGAEPASSPPGSPAGDSITFPFDDVGDVVIQSASLNSRSLRIRHADNRLHSDDTLGTFKSFRVTWTGRPQLGSRYLDITLWLWPPHDPQEPVHSPVARVVNLRMKQNEVFAPDLYNVGSFDGSRNHVVSINVDAANLRYQVSVLPGLASEWKPWHHDGAVLSQLAGLSVALEVQGGPAGASGWYDIDNVRIYGIPED